MRPYTNEQLKTALFSLNQTLDHKQTDHTLWQVKNGKLCNIFVFEDFKQAFTFMSNIALLAEQINHHPDWKNSYNQVDIALCTHEAKGITERDFQLAQKINALLNQRIPGSQQENLSLN